VEAASREGNRKVIAAAAVGLDDVQVVIEDGHVAGDFLEEETESTFE
jgi:hypothetical protein